MNKTSILVVEDDKPIRNLIVTTLKTHDYKYLAAENGSSAILEASSHNPNIVLLDLGLPDMEGVEVIKKIRTWSNMPIIVISARSEDTDKIEALDAGADDYITKPFSVEELLARIRVSQRRLAITQAGKQPEPQPVVHNSGWARDPGDLYYKGDTAVILPVLENYVKDILTTFKDDKRIVLWDLYNEPGGSGGYRYGERSLPLLQKIFTWGRTVNPSQPLSAVCAENNPRYR